MSIHTQYYAFLGIKCLLLKLLNAYSSRRWPIVNEYSLNYYKYYTIYKMVNHFDCICAIQHLRVNNLTPIIKQTSTENPLENLLNLMLKNVHKMMTWYLFIHTDKTRKFAFYIIKSQPSETGVITIPYITFPFHRIHNYLINMQFREH